jgi:hypothetical protein
MENMRLRYTAAISLPAFFLVGLALLVLSAPAAASEPCWHRVIDDWLASPNGTVRGTYAPSCLLRARKYGMETEDLRDYSNVIDAIDAALQDALRDKASPGTPTPAKPTGGKTTSNPTNYRTPQGTVVQSPYGRGVGKLGGTELPIPLLVLGGLGSVLLLTAGGLAATKWIKSTGRGRGTPPTAEP